MSDILQQGSVQLINRTRCNAEDAYQGEVTKTMMCAGLPEGAAQGSVPAFLIAIAAAAVVVAALLVWDGKKREE